MIMKTNIMIGTKMGASPMPMIPIEQVVSLMGAGQMCTTRLCEHSVPLTDLLFK